MYQQRWRSKRFLRAYHGDWIPEKRFKRWFLPSDLPRFLPPKGAARHGGAIERAIRARRFGVQEPAAQRMPTASLFMRDVERRLDVVVFRSCFARSAYEARSLVVQGKVTLNGHKCANPNTLLSPGDLISVDPKSVPMLSEELAKKALQQKAKDIVEGNEKPSQDEESAEAATAPEDAKPEAETETEAAAPAPADIAEKKSSKGKDKVKELPPGVRPFNLPPFAAPFLFIPPYLEPSFTTCSVIYVRHPTIVPHKDGYRTDLPSPYPAGGELYSMAWELYARNSPRVRGDDRRIKLTGKVSPNGFEKARARDRDLKRVALRRGWGRTKAVRGWRSDVAQAMVQAASKSNRSAAPKQA